MCSAAILLDTPVVTGDYSAESCNLISTDVAQALGLNFYAGSALRMPDGARIGMLAVIGREARGLSPVENGVLAELAGLVSRTIELRLAYLNSQQPDTWDDLNGNWPKTSTKTPLWPATSPPATAASTSMMTTCWPWYSAA